VTDAVEIAVTSTTVCVREEHSVPKDRVYVEDIYLTFLVSRAFLVPEPNEVLFENILN
jgi:hypothetical protein